jgi:HD-GYP domain-containing protein (c-di-GMP phosphodiesterase class II)
MTGVLAGLSRSRFLSTGHTFPRTTLGRALIGFSGAFDLAEGREPGHATRVAYLATELAHEMGLPEGEREAAFYGGLLHDSGVAVAPGQLAGFAEERDILGVLAFHAGQPSAFDLRAPEQVLDGMRRHSDSGAVVAAHLGLPEAAQLAIAGHHDSWENGQGVRPSAAAQLVALADKVESLLGANMPPLLLRQHAPVLAMEQAGTLVDPALAAAMYRMLKRDEFWLGLYDAGLPELLTSRGPISAGEEADVLAIAEVVATLGDHRNHHMGGYSVRLAESARSLAAHYGLPDERQNMVYLGALLHDVGTFGLPSRLLGKPDILNVEEMFKVQQHPMLAQQVLREIPGFEEIAWWIACHHERVDGKGYPNQLAGPDLPVEAQIIGVADVYHALCSERPHRWAMPSGEAMRVVKGLAGQQFSAEVVGRFETLLSG